MNEQTATPDQVRASRGSYCLIGCVVLVVIGFLLALLLAVGGFYLLRSAAETLTEEQPVELPKADMDPTQRQALFDRYHQFKSRVENRQPSPPLELTDREINALIQHHPDFEAAAGKVYVQMADDRITGRISLPVDGFTFLPTGLLGVGGRYLNGEATFRINISEGRPGLYIDNLKIRGRELPEQSREQLRRENFAEQWVRDPDRQDVLRHIDSLRVEGGKLIVEAAGARDNQTPEPIPAPASGAAA